MTAYLHPADLHQFITRKNIHRLTLFIWQKFVKTQGVALGCSIQPLWAKESKPSANLARNK
jgi:hypothetical protein